jgi:hypothetical protein
MDVQVRLLLPDLHSFQYILRSGIAGSYGSSILFFWGASIFFSLVVLIYIPTSSVREFTFISLPTFVTLYFLRSLSNKSEVDSWGDFNLHFLMTRIVEHLFMCFWTVGLLPLKTFIELICPFHHWVIDLGVVLVFLSSLHILVLLLCQIYSWQRYSPTL